MSIPQSSALYDNPDTGPGSIAEHYPALSIRSFSAAHEIPFGSPLARDSNGRAKVFSSSDEKFLGIALSSVEARGFEKGRYLENDPVAVLESGVVWVPVEGQVSVGGKVHLRLEDGKFTVTFEEGKTVPLEKAEFRSGVSHEGNAKLKI